MADEGGWAEEEVTTQSGCSRYCNAIFTAVCVAPLVILGAVILLGWNEKRDVCEQGTIAAGQDAVLQNGCASDMQNSGNLVMFHCDLQKTGLPSLSVSGDFAGKVPNVKLVGLAIVSEMKQCVEESHTEKTKDKIGGGTTTRTYYTYETQWKSSYVDSSSFHSMDSMSYRDNCGMANPPWPSRVPLSTAQYVDSAMLGPYTLAKDWVKMVPLDLPLQASSLPRDWAQGGGWYTKPANKTNHIGDLRVKFMGNDWSRATMTGLAENSGGTLTKWTGPDSWMCSGSTLGTLRQGVIDKATVFKDLAKEASKMTLVLRILGFVLMWFGFCAFFAPLEVAADCVPCIGPWLGDSVQAVVTCVTCPLACSCSLGVIGVVWVFMRPMVGLPLLLVFCAVFGASVYLKLQQQKRKAAARENAGIRENLYQS